MDLIQRMCALTDEIRRQIGVLIDRNGRIDKVVIGDAHKVFLPDLGRTRAGQRRFRGLRLIHTHLQEQGLTRDDLTDLCLLLLDMVVAVTQSERNGLPHIHAAHLLPHNLEGELWNVLPTQPAPTFSLQFDHFIHALEREFAQKQPMPQTVTGMDRALLIHLDNGLDSQMESRIAEARELAATADVEIVSVIVQRRQAPDPRYLIGKGRMQDLILQSMQMGIELLIVNHDLSPGQVRNLADLTELKIIDRTQLILDIFAQRAQSRDGKLQVELAQLKYLLPRLMYKNTAMSRLTGGIGGRGPGETKLEINRRRARDRINKLEGHIAELAQRRERRRQLRTRKQVPVVSVVGYTNAGKSTLINTLTNSEVLVENKLFATLDPVSRRIRFPEEREVIFTDTVGFIRDLPPDLFNAFKATFEELENADLLLHVVDITSPDMDIKIQSVNLLLDQLNLKHIPRLVVYNKIDCVSQESIHTRAECDSDCEFISARDPHSTVQLLKRIEKVLWEQGVWNGTFN